MQGRGVNVGANVTKWSMICLLFCLGSMSNEFTNNQMQALHDPYRFFSQTEWRNNLQSRHSSLFPYLLTFTVLAAFIYFIARFEDRLSSMPDIWGANLDLDAGEIAARNQAQTLSSAEQADNQTQAVEADTIEDRIAATGYQNEVPDWMKDPVFKEVLLKPKMTITKKGDTARTYDESTLQAIAKHDLGIETNWQPKKDPILCPETRDKIIGYSDNRELTAAIEDWVRDKELHPKPFHELSRLEQKKSLLKSQTIFNKYFEQKDKNKQTHTEQKSLHRSRSFER